MAVDDVLSLRVVGRFQSQNIVNTLHYRIAAQTADDKDINSALITAWRADIETAWLARHIDTYELVGLKSFRQSGDFKTPHFTSVGSAGSVVGTEEPAFVCRTITLYTESAKHRRRGRVMLSGTAAAQLETDDGSLTSAEITALEVLGVELVAPLEGGADSFQLCIPANATDPAEDIVDMAARETPSCVTSRRIKQFFVG